MFSSFSLIVADGMSVDLKRNIRRSMPKSRLHRSNVNAIAYH